MEEVSVKVKRSEDPVVFPQVKVVVFAAILRERLPDGLVIEDQEDDPLPQPVHEETVILPLNVALPESSRRNF